MPRRVAVTRRAGRRRKLPASPMTIVSARSRSACSGTKRSRPPVPCSSEPSTISLTLTGSVVAERAQRGQVHDDAALAVGGAAAVPAAVALGQLERRGAPGGLVQRRLHVVVGVEQHGRGAGRGRAGAVDRLGAVGGVVQARRPGSRLGERVEHPVGGALALLVRELPRVGDRLEGHQLGQLGMRPSHEAGHPVPQLHPDHSAGTGISAAGTPVQAWTPRAARAPRARRPRTGRRPARAPSSRRPPGSGTPGR